MEDILYGKLVWTDDPPKNPAWKTALLLFVAIFIMNFIYSDFKSTVYVLLAVLSAIVYLFFWMRQDRIGARMKIYDNGVLASVRSGGLGLSISSERFFKWSEVKSLKIETKGIFSKKNVLRIEIGGKMHAAGLVNRNSFVSSCEKLGKKVNI